MSLIHEGAVLRVRAQTYGTETIRFDPPIWAVSRETCSVKTGVYVTWITLPERDDDAPGDVIDQQDDFDVVPIGDLPEDICVALAKRVLLGDARGEGEDE
jgi:hypothetical protein